LSKGAACVAARIERVTRNLEMNIVEVVEDEKRIRQELNRHGTVMERGSQAQLDKKMTMK